MNRFLIVAMLLSVPAYADTLRIENVQADPVAFDVSRGESTNIRFQLSRSADVSLTIYDGRDLMVRSIKLPGLRTGENAVRWDGRDEAGRPVPSEAYAYTLAAETGNERTEYDLTDLTGGNEFIPTSVQWSSETGRIGYVLDRPARVNIRVGLNDNGPLLGTVANWVARAAGSHSETWNGSDASNVVQLGDHPRLEIHAQAFELPGNTLLVGSPQASVAVIENPAWGRKERVRTRVPSKRMFAHAQQSLTSRGDYRVRLVLPQVSTTDAGLHVVPGSVVAVRLEIDPADLERAVARRFEPVFFVDGQFAFENEVGFFPMTWNWDASAVNDGEHILTVNVRGYEGNFGIASIRVLKQGAVPAGSGNQ